MRESSLSALCVSVVIAPYPEMYNELENNEPATIKKQNNNGNRVLCVRVRVYGYPVHKSTRERIIWKYKVRVWIISYP